MGSRARAVVRDSYDDQAENYMQRRRMQARTNDRLLDLLRDDAGALLAGDWLDVGCGAGDMLAAVRAEHASHGALVGVDLSPRMIELARGRRIPCARFEVADAAALPYPDESFDVVASNSALHWLNVPEEGASPLPAFVEVRRVLRHGGRAAFSISADGTARSFRSAYRQVVEAHPGWRDAGQRFRPDPIGSMPLWEVVAQVTEAGLDVLQATTRYEPVRYARPQDYAEDVRAYGYGPYMAAFRAECREEAWHAVVGSFVDAVGSGPYVHDQFMSYVLASKCGARAGGGDR